jgi:CRISPR-associated endonuclease/helicase Cas3
MIVEECFLDVDDPLSDEFEFDKARSFQNEVYEWDNSGKKSFCVLSAPVGSGKTSAFKQIIEENELSLVTYPTNSLMRQQKEELEKDFNVQVINSESLSGSGIERRDELNSMFRGIRRLETDCIVTNPDILQAIIQGCYVDPHSKLLEVFDQFDSIIYDEFHFYDEFATSGIFLQSKIISERNPSCNVLFCSATPRCEYSEYIENVFGEEVRSIECETRSYGGDKFRYKTEFNRNKDSIMENKGLVCDQLVDSIEDRDGDFHTIVMFNSAKDSNDFYNYLCKNYKGIKDECVKDNGYDTYSKVDIDDSGGVLITTSKGEVGLDYEVEELYMENPWFGRKFIQRFGRAGRHSCAKVNVFSMRRLPFESKETISFSKFVSDIRESLKINEFNIENMRNLVAMRCVKALESRNDKREELYRDFKNNIDYYDRWSSFFNDIINLSGGGLFGNLNSDTENIKSIVENFYENSLDSLRGENTIVTVCYKRGEKSSKTLYSVNQSLRSYNIKDVKGDNVLILGDPGNDYKPTARYLGFSSTKELGRFDDFNQKLNRKISNSNLTEEQRNMVRLFMETVPSKYLKKPEKINSGDYIVEVNDNSIDVKNEKI